MHNNELRNAMFVGSMRGRHRKTPEHYAQMMILLRPSEMSLNSSAAQEGEMHLVKMGKRLEEMDAYAWVAKRL